MIHKFKIQIVVLLIFTFISKSFGQVQPKDTFKIEPVNLVKTFGKDMATVYSAPFNFNKKKTLFFGLYLASLYSFINWADEPIKNNFVTPSRKFKNKPLQLLSEVGDLYDHSSFYYGIAGAATVTAFYSIASKKNKHLKTVGLMLESYLISSIASSFLKMSIGRARPYNNIGAKDFTFFMYKNKPSRMSLPSGHTTSIFSMVTVIAKQYDSYYVKIPAYTFGISVALQRIGDDKHWFSDVYSGALLGYFTADILVNKHKKDSSISIYPTFFKNQIGCVFIF